MKILIISHMLVSILIYFLGFKKINKQERFCNSILALLLPVGGYLIVIILFISRNKDSKSINNDDDIENSVVLFTDRYDKDRATNFVPIEETLLINNTHIKRQQLIEALKKDTMRYIDKLKVALRDEDAETSHYAASAISKILRDLDLKIQALSAQYEKNKEDIKLAEEYLLILEEYLKTNLLDDFNKKRITYKYISVLEELIRNNNDHNYYDKIIDALFSVNDLEKLKTYCDRYIEEYRTENAYLLNLKYYYQSNDNKKFNEILNRISNSSIELSNKGLNVIRFWMEGV